MARTDRQQKLLEERRAAARDSLARYAKKGFYKQDYTALGYVLYEMNLLGLRSYEGISLAELKQLHKYVGRVFFRRQLHVAMSGDDRSCWSAGVGSGDFVDKTDRSSIILQLESASREVALFVELCFFHWQLPNHVTRDEVRVHLPSIGKYRGAVAASFHYRRVSERSYFCQRHCYPGCYIRGASFSDEFFAEAFERNDLSGVWWVMDNAWAEGLAWRPKSKPLSPMSLRIRCGVHAGQTVKVFTRSGECYGTLQFEEDAGRILLHQPDGKVHVSRAEEVLEIVPYRL